jgi:hypothetical protein
MQTQVDPGVFNQDPMANVQDMDFSIFDDMDLQTSDLMRLMYTHGKYVEELSTSNKMECTIKVLELDIKKGTQKKDENGQLQFKNGEPDCWDDKYYATLEYAGMESKQQLDYTIFNQLRKGGVYYAIGRFGTVNKYQDSTGLIIDSVLPISEMAMTKLKKFVLTERATKQSPKKATPKK